MLAAVKIIVMFFSAVWTLILMAPIQCRGSIGEQMMELKWQFLILNGLSVNIFSADFHLWVNYHSSMKKLNLAAIKMIMQVMHVTVILWLVKDHQKAQLSKNASVALFLLTTHQICHLVTCWRITHIYSVCSLYMGKLFEHLKAEMWSV